jgi:hypothetical protein
MRVVDAPALAAAWGHDCRGRNPEHHGCPKVAYVLP